MRILFPPVFSCAHERKSWKTDTSVCLQGPNTHAHTHTHARTHTHTHTHIVSTCAHRETETERQTERDRDTETDRQTDRDRGNGGTSIGNIKDLNKISLITNSSMTQLVFTSVITTQISRERKLVYDNCLFSFLWASLGQS